MTCDCERCLYRNAAWHCETCDRFLCSPCAGLCGLDHDITGLPPTDGKPKRQPSRQLSLALCIVILCIVILTACAAALLIHARHDSHAHDWRDEVIMQLAADTERLSVQLAPMRPQLDYLADQLDNLAFRVVADTEQLSLEVSWLREHLADQLDNLTFRVVADTEQLSLEVSWLRDHLDHLAFDLNELRLLPDELATAIELLDADR